MSDEQMTKRSGRLDKNKIVIFILGVLIVFLVITIIVFVAIKMINSSKKKGPEVVVVPDPIETSTPITLPIDPGIVTTTTPGGLGGDVWEGEKYTFGDFYNVPEDDFEPKPQVIDLPLNVKTDISNYHDLARKIDIESGLESLNENGFAVVPNPYSQEANNFLTTYKLLESKDVPSLITSDFLIYYYQNQLKDVHKEIESIVFYENLWEINRELYQIAKDRYEEKLLEEGIVNDLVLEGSRLELAYFATVLGLLKPTEEQISKEVGFDNKVGFSIAEANRFSIQFPDYLRNDVVEEIDLIRESKYLTKSPVMLYVRDYQDFAVPKEYQANARLNNFYLATKWINSVFPLYYRTDDCEDCLLDKDDWRINMYTALLISEDFDKSQSLKNKWAKIYKIRSFFNGLRGDLNYLHYRQTFQELFVGEEEEGKEVSVEEILSSELENPAERLAEVDEKLEKIQEAISEFNFQEIEGTLDKTSTSTKPFLGMKMLVSSYWPNDYIFNQLSYPNVNLYKGNQKKFVNYNNTHCAIKVNYQKGEYRCFGFGYDIINLITDIDAEENIYFAENTNYDDYEDQIKKLREQLSNFNRQTWHSNNYWSILDISKKLLSRPYEERPSFARTKEWEKKDINTAIGAWLNLQLEADIFDLRKSSGVGNLTNMSEDHKFSTHTYIEPNLTLIQELLANTRMLHEMLDKLDINAHNNSALLKLSDLIEDFEKLEIMIKKELSGQDLNKDDTKFLNEFLKEFEVKEKGEKTLRFDSEHSRKYVTVSLEGVNLLLVIYEKDGKKVLAIGPVFNYWENRSR